MADHMHDCSCHLIVPPAVEDRDALAQEFRDFLQPSGFEPAESDYIFADRLIAAGFRRGPAPTEATEGPLTCANYGMYRSSVPGRPDMIQAVLAIHKPESCDPGCCDDDMCFTCRMEWPCETVCAIENTLPKETR